MHKTRPRGPITTSSAVSPATSQSYADTSMNCGLQGDDRASGRLLLIGLGTYAHRLLRMPPSSLVFLPTSWAEFVGLAGGGIVTPPQP